LKLAIQQLAIQQYQRFDHRINVNSGGWGLL
jgi:hypothetical protein